MLLKPHSRIQVIEGARNNLPDPEALRGAGAIQELAQGLTADDLLLVLISGGDLKAWALLKAPVAAVVPPDACPHVAVQHCCAVPAFAVIFSLPYPTNFPPGMQQGRAGGCQLLQRTGCLPALWGG